MSWELNNSSKVQGSLTLYRLQGDRRTNGEGEDSRRAILNARPENAQEFLSFLHQKMTSVSGACLGDMLGFMGQITTPEK